MAKTPKKPAPKSAASAEATTKPKQPAKPRQLKAPKYRSFRLQKRIKPQGPKVKGGLKLLRQAVVLLAKNWKVFAGIIAVYGVLNVALVQGFSAVDGLTDVKATLDKLFTGSWDQLGNGITLFVYLLGSSGNTLSPTAGAYQLMLTLVISLALIWALREVNTGRTIRIRDGFYQGVYPLVQFVLTLAVLGIQLLPMAVGVMLYSTVTSNGIAASGMEQLLWAVVGVLFALVSLYMLSSSLFALYIVTLPGMTPLAALRSARQLVANRRLLVLRRVIFLPLALLFVAAVLVIPLILFATPVAPWAFFVITMIFIAVIHSYLYALYRELL